MGKHTTYSPIFQVGNKHTAESGSPPQIDGNIRKRYHGYFENEYGEQAVFVYDYEVGQGTLWMGDAGWEQPRPVIEGRVPDLILNPREAIWLANCWNTAVERLP